jgi:hypothetical protein
MRPDKAGWGRKSLDKAWKEWTRLYKQDKTKQGRTRQTMSVKAGKGCTRLDKAGQGWTGLDNARQGRTMLDKAIKAGEGWTMPDKAGQGWKKPDKVW